VTETSPGRLRPGPANALTDVTGLQIGHASRRGAGWLTGTTVIVTRGDGATAGVDVRGGGPGTKRTRSARFACNGSDVIQLHLQG
jgi:L-aminopeptidase/D-esterase-like protein